MRKKPILTLLSTAMITAVAALSVPMTTAIAAPAEKAREQSKFTNNAYIVRLAEQPVAAFDGNKSFAATRPRKGQKIDPNSPAVVNYRSFLESRQDAVLSGVGGGKKLHSYGYVFNGFAAELTAAQAEKLAATSGVLSVTKDEARALDTSSTPAFLGLTAAGGAWSQTKGEGVIIGIVDGGIWPESLSFSDRTGTNGNATKDGKLSYRQIPGWNGRCVPGEEFNASNCNQKLIGARYYNAGWGGNAGIDVQLPWEYNSPRDLGGHGSHVASTAGGNENVPTTGPASVFGSISGIAPRARIAAYKVCWQTAPGGGGGGSCFTTDSVAAIDQAVADGVDVINFSISGSRTSFRDPVEIAFLFAADAGVFVAASAGNSGPPTSTVAHPGPWLTTVAAGTHNRNGQGTVTLGNGASYTGASYATAMPASPLVDAAGLALAPATAADAELCAPGSLDPALTAGKAVLCKRGVYALVDKSAEVAAKGGAGMVLYNDPAGATNTLALFHSVPSVHLVAASGLAVKSYITTTGAGATASISQANILYNATAPLTASFSSRGPLLAGNGDVLKPDLIAPGESILAAVAPPGNRDREFDLYSGTSMSSPHVAGLAALIKEAKPGWSPMAIKSALMTTGVDVLDGGTPPAAENNPILIFRQGAGHVQPNSALDPGLVYDSGFSDWLSFLCGAQPGGGCTGVTPMDPSNLNQASIAIGDLGGRQTVARRVTNVSGKPLKLDASVTGMTGFTVTVTPASLTLAPGETKSFEVTFLRTTAALNAYTGGQLRWTGGGYTVRSPIVVRPVALGAPASVSGTGAPLSYSVVFGYSGPFSATPRGLIPAVLTNGTVTDDPTDGACSLTAPNAQLIPVAIPAGTTFARFSLFDADVSPGADIDLCVANSAGTIVGSSGSGTSAEEVNLLNPAAGNYTVVVQGWGVVGSSPFTLNTWLLGTMDAGNMTVSAPASATTGANGTINLTFSGLAAGTKYLGSVAYAGAAGMPNPTIVTVNP